MKKYLNRFLIRLLPKRMGKKLLIEMMETDEEYGLYDKTFTPQEKEKLFISTHKPTRTESIDSDIKIGVNGKRKKTNIRGNLTIKELIGILKDMNPDAVVCIGENNGFSHTPRMEYSSIENCVEVKNASYIDDGGDEVVGDIVYFI